MSCAPTCEYRTSQTPARMPPPQSGSRSALAVRSATVSSTSSPGICDTMRRFPGGRNLQFTGVVFDGGNFSGAQFSGGTVDFSFAQFSGGQVRFTDARFSGGTVHFVGAQFSGGQVHFTDARFSGGTVHFVGAQFSGGTVDFSSAEFSGGTVDFSLVDEWSHPPRFDWGGHAARRGQAANRHRWRVSIALGSEKVATRGGAGESSCRTVASPPGVTVGRALRASASVTSNCQTV